VHQRVAHQHPRQAAILLRKAQQRSDDGFGLLEAADVLQLAAVCAPRPVKFAAPSERAKAELAGLKAWYETWGVSLD